MGPADPTAMPHGVTEPESAKPAAAARHIARTLAIEVGGDDEFAAAIDVVITRWFATARRAAEECRWTDVGLTGVPELLGRLGFSHLVDRLTLREAAVLLALLPQLPSITHHGPSLGQALERWLGQPVRYIPHAQRQRHFDPADQSLLRKRYSRLGVDLVLGDSMIEHRSTVAFEVDLRGDHAVARLIAGGWANVAGRDVAPTEKLVGLLDTLVSSSISVEWRWRLPELKRKPVWRLGVAVQSRVGSTTKLRESFSA